MIIPPNEGCRQAVDCGRDYVKAGAPLEALPKALSFCDNEEEKFFFMYGMILEKLGAV